MAGVFDASGAVGKSLGDASRKRGGVGRLMRYADDSS